MDLIDVASKEIGTQATTDGKQKYGKWYGMDGVAWCHIFVSWCANQAGISTDIVPKDSSTTNGMNKFKSWNRFKEKGTYTPARNDLVYFKSNGWSHVGIVEYVNEGIVHTIEGNTLVGTDPHYCVARHEYELGNSHITGYGIVSQYISSNDTDTPTTHDDEKQETPAEVYDDTELKLLRKMLKRYQNGDSEQDQETITFRELKRKDRVSHDVVLIGYASDGKSYTIPIIGELKITWERKGTAGKLTFTMYYDERITMEEGGKVLLFIDNQPIFQGFIFTQKLSGNNKIAITVYDQLRYLKNEDTYIYEDLSADSLIKMIAKDFRLNVGDLDKTGYSMSRNEDGTELFDIIQNSLDTTLMATGNIFTLYDDFGSLTLKKPWFVQCFIDADTIQDFSYTQSIDKGVYNQIKLTYKNQEKGVLDVFLQKNDKSINKWGVLQYYEELDDKRVAKLKGTILLMMYNSISKKLSVSKVWGDIKVRAGCYVPVFLDLKYAKLESYMLVDKVVHTFNNGIHTMDINLSGGGFDAS